MISLELEKILRSIGKLIWRQTTQVRFYYFSKEGVSDTAPPYYHYYIATEDIESGIIIYFWDGKVYLDEETYMRVLKMRAFS